MGFVYVVEAGKHCKIGISEHSVDQRTKSLQTGCPVKFQRVWCSRNIPDHLACEKILHNYFRDRNTNGEWFEIPFFEAAEQADKVCTIGADKKRIEDLEKENAELRDRLMHSFTVDNLTSAFSKMLQEGMA